MFTIEGLIDDKRCSITWEAGIIYGDKEPLKKAFRLNKNDYGRLGLYPYVTDKNYLYDEIPSFCLIYENVFDYVISIKSDWEKLYKKH